MKPEELRIGNWVNALYELPIQVDRDDFAYHSGLGKIEGFTPIPLTEQWLKDFGFTHDGGDGWLSPIGEHFYWCLRDEFIHKMYRNTKFIGVKYVHQLQNLYYALTGTELKKGSLPTHKPN